MANLPNVDGFEVRRELGRGGMGVAFEAVRVADGRRAVLKMILAGACPSLEQMARFRVEAEAASCLDHPNIVKLFGCSLWQGCPYLIFEFVPGGDLAGRIAGRPQSAEWSARIALGLCRALEHAHARGILHRDLKPANVLLAEDGTPKVADFGLAKFVRPIDQVSDEFCTTIGQAADWDRELWELFRSHRGDNQRRAFLDVVVEATVERCRPALGWGTGTELYDEAKRFAAACVNPGPAASGLKEMLGGLTRDGSVFGSPQYMAPEQAAGDTGAFGPETDVYGLGGVLYSMLTGRPPFTGDHLPLLLQRIRAERPTPFGPDVDPELAAICLRCIEKAPGRRYPSAAAVAAALDDYLSQFADLAPTPGVRPEDATVHFLPPIAPPASRRDRP